jgi:hypothetical protein
MRGSSALTREGRTKLVAVGRGARAREREREREREKRNIVGPDGLAVERKLAVNS